MIHKSNNKKILFVVPNIIGIYEKPATPHVGIAYLAAICRENGHQVRIVDMRLDKKKEYLFDVINKFGPDFIGVYSSSFQHDISYRIIKEIKSNFNISIIIGGPHVSTVQKDILKDTLADIAVYGEGDQTIIEILDNIPVKNIKGIIWRKNPQEIVMNSPRPFIEDLDKLPFPAYDLFKLNEYLDNKIPIVSSRGCPGACIYCSIKMIFGRGFRARSPQNVIKEFEYWYNLGYKHFQFTDDCFSYDIKRAEKICELLVEKNINIHWELRNGIRVDTITYNLLKKMKRSGCSVIAFGIESGDQEVLRKMGKGITLDTIKKAVHMTHEVGIKTVGFFMIGTPGDTFEKFKKSLSFAKSLPLNEFRFYTTIPYPRTPLYNWVSKSGRWIQNPEEYLNSFYAWGDSPVFDTKEFPASERRKAFRIAEKSVMKKFLVSQFGSFLGPIAFQFWQNKITRKFAMKPGIKLLSFLRKQGISV